MAFLILLFFSIIFILPVDPEKFFLINKPFFGKNKLNFIFIFFKLNTYFLESKIKGKFYSIKILY